MAAKRYTLRHRTLDVELEHTDGVVRRFTLRSINGSDRDEYLEILGEKLVLDQDGKPTKGMKNVTGLRAKLISLSLYDEAGIRVESDVIAKWPDETVEGLFQDAQTLSALTQEVVDSVGNGSGVSGSSGSVSPTK